MKIDYNIPIATLICVDGSFKELNHDYFPIHIKNINENFEIWNTYDEYGNHIKTTCSNGLILNFHYNHDVLDYIMIDIDNSVYRNNYALKSINGKRLVSTWSRSKGRIPVNDIAGLWLYGHKYIIYRKN